MKNLIVIIFSVLNLSSYGQQRITIKLHSIVDYDGYEDFANSSIQKLELVLNSEKFKQKVLASKYIKTKGLSNQEIYDLIIRAHEEQGLGGTDNVVDLRIRTISIGSDGAKWMRNCEPNSWAGTIGIDGQGDGITAICPQRLKMWSEQNDYGSLAGHYAHEYMHILGFSHRGLNKRKSLVYKIGDIVEEIINEGHYIDQEGQH